MKQVKRFLLESKAEQGVLTVEATIVLTTFVFFFLSILSYAQLFAAQNMISHSIMQACKTLTTDHYGDKVAESISSGTSIEWRKLLGLFVNKENIPNSPPSYVATDTITGDKWYTDASYTKNAARQVTLAYIGGASLGAEGNTNSILQRLRVKGGTGGLDFSDTAISGKDLTIKVKYEVELWFSPMFNLDGIKMEQSVKGRMWG